VLVRVESGAQLNSLSYTQRAVRTDVQRRALLYQQRGTTWQQQF